MDNPLLALLFPSLLVVPAMGMLSRSGSGGPAACELRRKALHVASGLAALSFPLILTSSWMVVAALTLVMAWMLAVRNLPALRRLFGCVLHDAGRKSFGELYFALAIAALLLLPHRHPLLFAAPVLVLTFADAAAAVIGRALPLGKFRHIAVGKTWSGTIAFFLVALGVTFLLIGCLTPLGAGPAFGISLAVAAATTPVEALSSRGLDNLFVPAVTWLMLFSLTPGV